MTWQNWRCELVWYLLAQSQLLVSVYCKHYTIVFINIIVCSICYIVLLRLPLLLQEVVDQMVTAVVKGDVNTLKNILKPNPNFVNAKFYYEYDDFNFVS